MKGNVRSKALGLLLALVILIGLIHTAALAEPHTHDDITFDKAWSKTSDKPSTTGNYYLTEDIELDSTWNIPQNITIKLCLNGHTLSYSGGNTINVNASSKLYVYDCDSDHKGTIEQTYEYSNSYRAINFSGESATVEIYGGTIKAYARAISCASENCSLVVDGENVEIISTGGNPYTNPGIGVYFANGKRVEIRNSKLIKNESFGGYGLYVLDISENVTILGGTFNGTGCAVSLYNRLNTSYTVTITGGTFNGEVYLNSSNPSISGGIFNGEVSVENASNFITGGTYIVKPDDDLITNGYFATNITPTTWAVMDHVEIFYNPNGWDSTSNTFSQRYDTPDEPINLPTFEELGWTKPDGRNFIEWNTLPDGGGTKYQPGDPFNVTPITFYAIWGPVASVTHEGTTTPYNTLALAINNAEDGDTVTLLGDITLKAEVSINKNITLEGNNKTITMSGADAYLIVPEGKIATIQNLTVTGSSAEYGIKAVKSTLTLNNIKINGVFSAAGLCVNSATVIIYGQDTEITAPEGFSIDTSAYSSIPSVLYIYAGKISSIGNSASRPSGDNQCHQDIYLRGGTVHKISAMHYNDKIDIQDGVIDTILYGYNTIPQGYDGTNHSLTISGGKIKPVLDFSPAMISGGKFSLHPINEKKGDSYDIRLVPGYEVFTNVETDSNDYPYLVASPLTVTFNANNGNSPATTEQKVPNNYEAILNANTFTPTSGGKTFTGWNTSPSPTEESPGTVYEDNARVRLISSTTLYAQWTDIAATAPTINSLTSLTGENALSYGASDGKINITATPATDTEYNVTYQWYSNTTESNSGGTAIDDATTSDYTLPTGIGAGTYYYYCIVTATRKDNDMKATATSNVATVTVNKAASSSATVNKNDIIYNNTAQPLVKVTGEAVGGTMYYALTRENTAPSAESYTTSIPTAIDEGTYYVWYKVIGDSNHLDTAVQCIQATITLESYTISYYGLENSTGAAENPTSYTMKSNAITLNNPNKPGYDFTGWTGSNGTTPSMAVTIASGSSGNKNYTANWKIISYKISFDLNGGELEEDQGNPTSYDINSENFSPNIPRKRGYDFEGWLLSGDNAVSRDLTIPNGTTGDREYIAKWNVHFYTISYDLGGGTVSLDNPINYTIESPDIVLRSPDKTAYDFKGWILSGDSTWEISTDVTIPHNSTGDREYIALWSPIEYSISYNLNIAVVSPANPDNYDVESEDIKLISPDKTGYIFTGWIGTELSEASTDVIIPSQPLG